jgi:signal transduction histidine kinase
MVSKIDTEQGLPSQNTFNVATGSGDTNVVWIGTNRGVASYRPGGGSPLLAVSGAIAGRYYMADEVLAGLVLDYNQGFAIDVAASSSRTFPEQFQYVFTFRDSRGQETTAPPTRIPRMTSDVLRPGNYWEEVRAYNVDLVESAPVTVAITIKGAPFPWTSTALGTLLALALIALAWGWRQNKRLTRTNVALAETRMELANETETERRRIARDLHDQTLADLRRLMLLTDQLPKSESSNGHVEPSKIRDEIESVSTEIRRICEDLSPSALANVGLAAALEWALADAVQHQPPEKKFEYDFICDVGIDEKLRLEPAAQIQIYRIVQEALSNVCRHSSASKVRLSVATETSGDLIIELEDDGRGFDGSKLGKAGRGLANIRSRASLIEARVNWSVRPEGGTLFTLRKRAAPALCLSDGVS